MKTIVAVTVNNFSLIPVSRYILQSFSENYGLHTAECQIDGVDTFVSETQTYCLQRFKDKTAFYNQSKRLRFIKYVRLFYYVFTKTVVQKTDIVYTPDVQVLAIFFWLRKVFNIRSKLVYHQFELIDPHSSKGAERYSFSVLLKNASRINLCIFPEGNRLNFFADITKIDFRKCMLFRNTCTLKQTDYSKPLDLDGVKKDDIVVAHIGNVGPDHYLNSFLTVVDLFKDNSRVHFLMIGRLDNYAKAMISRVSNKNFTFRKEISHQLLAQYYEFIDIGFILYKGVDLNFEYCAPNKLYEYWSHGNYVIGHRLTGLNGVFKHSKMGELVNMSDPEEVYNKIIKFLNSDKPNLKSDIKKLFRQEYEITKDLSTLKNRMYELA